MLHSALSVSLSRSFKQVVEGLCVAASVLLEKAANPYYPARNSYYSLTRAILYAKLRYLCTLRIVLLCTRRSCLVTHFHTNILYSHWK